MGSTLVFCKKVGEVKISKTLTPEFMCLYQQSVLLLLRDRGVLSSMQYQSCIDALLERNSL